MLARRGALVQSQHAAYEQDYADAAVITEAIGELLPNITLGDSELPRFCRLAIKSAHNRSFSMDANFSLFPRIAAAISILGLSLVFAPASAQSAELSSLAGAWTGSGTIALSDGSIERLRCRATYQVDASGTGLQQSLRCASDSYRFDLGSDLVNQGGRISGTWSESSRGISGSLEGRVGGGRITALVEGAGFSANIRVTTAGQHQSVSIVSQGDIRQVSISMVRR
jgi:hypothetical protein